MAKSRLYGPASRVVERVEHQIAKQIREIMKQEGISYSDLGCKMHLPTKRALALLNWTHHAPSLLELAKAVDALDAILMVGSWEVVPAKSKKGKQK